MSSCRWLAWFGWGATWLGALQGLGGSRRVAWCGLGMAGYSQQGYLSAFAGKRASKRARVGEALGRYQRCRVWAGILASRFRTFTRSYIRTFIQGHSTCQARGAPRGCHAYLDLHRCTCCTFTSDLRLPLWHTGRTSSCRYHGADNVLGRI